MVKKKGATSTHKAKDTGQQSNDKEGQTLLEKAVSSLEHWDPLEADTFSSTENQVLQVMSLQETGVGQGKPSIRCPEAFKC